MKKRKKKYQKSNKLLNFLKEYSALLTIGVTILAFIFNVIMNYYNKISSTEFYFQYLSIKINSNWLDKKSSIDTNTSLANHYIFEVPTFNNDINKLLYVNSDKLSDYFITYLIIRQRGETPGKNIKLTFKQLENNNLQKEEAIIKDAPNKIVEKKIKYPFEKGEELKIPISICKSESDTNINLDQCFYQKLIPISIEYENKYWFSKKNVKIREYLETDVIIDGKIVTGKGGTIEEESTNKKWYFK